jgi:hypothetical protein
LAIAPVLLATDIPEASVERAATIEVFERVGNSTHGVLGAAIDERFGSQR